MGQVTIGGVVYDIYGTRAEFDDYMKARVNNSVWASAGGTDRDRSLVSAARVFNRQPWVGTKTLTTQPLAWPREGVEGFDNATTPTEVEEGSYEMAYQILDDAEVYERANSQVNVKRVGAGSAQVEFFKQSGGSSKRLPFIVNDIVKEFISGDSTFSVASGVCDDVKTPQSTDFGIEYGRNKGYY